MAIKENQSKNYRIYIKSTKEWVEVPEEVYQEHTRFYDAFRKEVTLSWLIVSKALL